jgi:hypothetical protein
MSWKPALLAFVTTALLGLLLSGFLRTSPGHEAAGQPPTRIEQPADSRNVTPSTPPRAFDTPAPTLRELKARRIA